MSPENEVLVSRFENPALHEINSETNSIRNKVFKLVARTSLAAASLYVGINAIPAEHENILSVSAAHAELTPMAEVQGANNFDNAKIAEAGVAENGMAFPTGWGQPGECMVSAQRWASAANGGKNIWNYSGSGVISIYTKSGGVEVAMDKLKAGDILQKASAGDDADTNWSSVHTVVFRGYGSNGTVNIVDANRGYDGLVRVTDNYALTAKSGWKWRAFRMGKTSSTAPTPPQPKGRLALINSLNAAYAKDEITSGGWHGLTGNNDAFYISASGTHVALINGSGDAWGTDIAEDKLRVNSTGLVPLYVPKDPNYPGGVKKIETDKDGNMIAITNCSSAWGYRNKPGEQHWVPMTSCGDAIDVDVGSGRFGLVNSCGGAYISDVGYGWTPALNCGDAKDIEIGESSRIMAINSTNTAYLYDAANGRWVNKTPVGDARKIAIGKDKIMVVSSGGAAWGADIGSNLAAPMTRLTADGDAKAISVGANDRMGIINSGGAAFASDEIVQGGKWTPESGNGDAKKFVVG